MLAVTATGILVFSTLIRVIFTGIDNKLTELRKGRSFVLEREHTIKDPDNPFASARDRQPRQPIVLHRQRDAE